MCAKQLFPNKNFELHSMNQLKSQNICPSIAGFAVQIGNTLFLWEVLKLQRKTAFLTGCGCFDQLQNYIHRV